MPPLDGRDYPLLVPLLVMFLPNRLKKEA